MTDRRVPPDRDNDCAPTPIKCGSSSCASTPAVRSSTSLVLIGLGHPAGQHRDSCGVAQVPIGLAGPPLANGEHAQGEFFVPLATTEGILVASCSRGMKLPREAGGITTTVIDDRVQRAPVVSFNIAREARAFAVWLDEHFEQVAATTQEPTTSDDSRSIRTYAHWERPSTNAEEHF